MCLFCHPFWHFHLYLQTFWEVWRKRDGAGTARKLLLPGVFVVGVFFTLAQALPTELPPQKDGTSTAFHNFYLGTWPMSRSTCFPEASFIPCWHLRGAHTVVLRGTWRRPAQPPWEGWSHFKEGTKETDGLGKSILATGPKTHSLRSNWRASWSGQTEHGSIN